MIGNFCGWIFTIEMVFKVFAMGFVLGEKTYLRSSWNVMDAVIVVAFLVE